MIKSRALVQLELPAPPEPEPNFTDNCWIKLEEPPRCLLLELFTVLSKHPLCICICVAVCLNTCVSVYKYMHGHIWTYTWACACAPASTNACAQGSSVYYYIQLHVPTVHVFLHICAYTLTWTYTDVYECTDLHHLLLVPNWVANRKQ